MTSRRIFLRAAIVMGASSFDGSRVMIECGHRTRVGTAIEVDLNPPAPAKTRPWVDEVSHWYSSKGAAPHLPQDRRSMGLKGSLASSSRKSVDGGKSVSFGVEIDG